MQSIQVNTVNQIYCYRQQLYLISIGSNFNTITRLDYIITYVGLGLFHIPTYQT